MADTTQRNRHVVLFPFPAQGHLAGFLALARLLRRELQDGVTITIVCTPLTVAALRSSVADADAGSSSSISFHALPFVPADHGLPADCESTSSLSNRGDFMKLFEAFDDFLSGLTGGVHKGEENEEPTAANVCVIADVFVSWTVDVARRHGLAHAFFLSCGAFGSVILHALWANMPALPFGPDGTLRLPEHPAVVIHRSQLSPTFTCGDERWTRARAHGAGHAAAHPRRRSGIPLGPLVRGVPASDKDDGGNDWRILRWLDTQRLSSVVYISFGSQNTIRANQMAELAAALESTGRPFVWAVRPPVGFDVNGAFRDEWLPGGFEARARASGRGLVVRGWAPQLRILAHAATGAFLSHCGWNSVLESLTHGVPLLGWPLAAEKFYNVKILAEEWGACVEVARGNMEKSRVVEAVEKVMGDTAESEALSRAWAEDGGSSRAALHDFFKAMHLL
ncbi:unnamed protein product [Miscanthus lutarioriparius]|uniref:Glycosyltransferase N-terminal domain-containing protein n=1 Tax=Miscanthus lutarioriparius TaxID=422564 RepID=A0A811QKW3_9POAL|nr:unnamed protein product [Miscanthus lutarioriparius]